MAGTVIDLKDTYEKVSDSTAEDIAALWVNWSTKRQPKLNQWDETRNYLYATSTATTSAGALPWKNSVHIPKLTQIRDNLLANYESTLFPNRKWMSWEGSSQEDQAKAQAIEAFMQDVVERSNFRSVVTELLCDYIDTGNAFATSIYEQNMFEDDRGNFNPGYEGPVAVRIDPYDTVFNPTASNYFETPKINRYIKSIGELVKMSTQPEGGIWALALEKTEIMRQAGSVCTVDDFHKDLGYTVDGFGSLKEYYGSDFVEILEFKGDYYDKEARKLHQNMRIIVIDRSITVYAGKNDSWAGNRDQVHCGWRNRAGNLYGMGPLDNLIGMQYRMDHLENLKDDAMDLMIHPPLVIVGEVEEFTYGPGEEINIIGEGSVTELGRNASGIVTAENSIDKIAFQMEEFAGAPKQSMGVRTPGEKTKFEVQTLEMAASRIFQEKITNFEIKIVEPLLNMMLADARKNMSEGVTLKIWNKKYDMAIFTALKPEDLNGNGTIRPRGARHFGEQALMIQNLVQLSQTPLWQQIQPNVSTDQLSNMVNDLFQLEDWGVIRQNQGLTETAEKTEYAGSLEQTVMERQAAKPGAV